MKIEQSITLPAKPNVVEENNTKAVYEIEALYPGYGQTLGNTLRRVILSSIQGAAITKVSIEGANHEFTTMDGIKEDTLEILLNLKKIRFKLDSSESQEIYIKKKGIGPLTAADIETPTQVTVTNKDQYIAELTNNNSKFNAKLTVEQGIGFVPHEERQKGKAEIGTILLDAIYSPIRRVNYEIENMRVGDRVDFDRLRLSIETDGTVTPRDVYKKAISLIVTQFQAISSFRDSSEEEEEVTPKGTDLSKERGTIDELNVSARIMNALKAGDIKTLHDLERLGKKGIKEIKGLGVSAIVEIEEALEERGIKLD